MPLTRTNQDGTSDALRIQADPPAAKVGGSSHAYLPTADMEAILTTASTTKPPPTIVAATRKDTGKKGLKGAAGWGLESYHIDGKALASCKIKILIARASAFSGASKTEVRKAVDGSEFVRTARGANGKATATTLLLARVVRLMHDAFVTPGTTRHGVSWPGNPPKNGREPQKGKKAKGGEGRKRGAVNTPEPEPEQAFESDSGSESDDHDEGQSGSDGEEDAADHEAFLARMEAYLAKHGRPDGGSTKRKRGRAPLAARRRPRATKPIPRVDVSDGSGDESDGAGQAPPAKPQGSTGGQDNDHALGVLGQGLAAVLNAVASLPAAAAAAPTEATSAKARKKRYNEDNRQRQIATGKVDDATGFANVSCDASAGGTMLPFEYHDALADGKYDLCFASVAWGVSAVKKIRIDGGELITAKTPRRQISIDQWHDVALQYGNSLPEGQRKRFLAYVDKVRTYGRRYSPERAMYYDRLYRARVVSNGGAPPNWEPDIMFFLEAFTGVNAVQCPCGRPGCLPGDCDSYGDSGHPTNCQVVPPSHSHRDHGADRHRARGQHADRGGQGQPAPQRDPRAAVPCRNYNSSGGCSRQSCPFGHVLCCPTCISEPRKQKCPGAAQGARNDPAPGAGRR